jgi:hypothetical protein
VCGTYPKSLYLIGLGASLHTGLVAGTCRRRSVSGSLKHVGSSLTQRSHRALTETCPKLEARYQTKGPLEFLEKYCVVSLT